jgi:hypothetical protein
MNTDIKPHVFDAATLSTQVEAILGEDYYVAINPAGDFPNVEIGTTGGGIEYVALTAEPGRYYATQWTDGPYGGGREDNEFDTLAEAVEFARVGTTRIG